MHLRSARKSWAAELQSDCFAKATGTMRHLFSTPFQHRLCNVGVQCSERTGVDGTGVNTRLRIEPCWRTSWQQQGRMWCTGLCNGTRRGAGGQKTTRGAGGTEDRAESEHRGSNRKLAPPRRLAVLWHRTVERRNSVVCPGQRRRSVDTWLTRTDKPGGRLFSEGRDHARANHARVGGRRRR